MKKFITLFLISASGICAAQEGSFKTLRFDENYRYLGKDTATNSYQRLKFTPLTKDKTTYLSVGGELRYQYFHFTNQDWGEAPQDKDGFVLTRYLAHADLHAGKHFRTFVQLQSSTASGQVGTPSPVNENILDLHQAFVDLSDQNFTVRLGRQELMYGSQRLVSVRDAPNNRQAFDAAKLMYSSKSVKIDGFFSYYVPAKPNIFDDGFNKSTRFWGAYAVINKVPVIGNLDLYYLGIDKKTATFDEGTGKETRHSVGSRIWRTTPTWQYDMEGLYQFGEFAERTISAWTMSANLSYTFSQTKYKPVIGIKTEAISGDKNYGDGRLNTFNPLFPRGGYFGLAALIGPSNLIDAHPYLQISLSKKLKFNQDYDLFWRMERNDGLYAVNGRMLYSGKAGTSKQIGRQLGSELEYTPNKHLLLRQEITWFSAGDYLKEAGPGKDILMVGSTMIFKF